MSVLLLLLACAGSDDGAARGSDTAGAADCPDAAAPALSTTTWTAAGAMPATGLNSVTSLGDAPVWLGSHLTGTWVAGSDLAWSPTQAQVSHTLSEIALRPGDPDGAYRSSGGRLSRTRDRGQSWEDLVLDASRPDEIPTVWAIASTPYQPDRLLVLESDGAAWLSEDDGETSTFMGYASFREPPANDDPSMTWGWRLLPEVEPGGRIFFGDGFGVSTSDDGMATWTHRLDVPEGATPLLRDPRDPDHLLLGSGSGYYETHDAGETWSLHALASGVTAGAWAPDGSWVALMGSAAVYVSTDGAASFAETPAALAMPMSAVILGDGRLLVAQHHGVGVSADRGATWTDVSAGLASTDPSVLLTDPDCPAVVWAGSQCGGGLFRSEDHGGTWQPVDHYFHYFMGLHEDPSVEGRFWAVSDDALARSDDDGVTWETVYRRAHFHGFVTHPDHPDMLLLGSVGSGGWADDRMHVYATTDAGLTWADASAGLPDTGASAHALLRWPGSPEVVLLGTYKGEDVAHLSGAGVGLYRSTDGAANWTQVPIDVTDVAALAESPLGVVAATDDGLWLGTEEGATWAPLNGPTGQVLAVAFEGQLGLAYTDSGTAWFSTDGGATWSQRSDGLPVPSRVTLASVGIAADASMAWVTVLNEGVYRVGLEPTP